MMRDTDGAARRRPDDDENPTDRLPGPARPLSAREREHHVDVMMALRHAYESDPVAHGRVMAERLIRNAWSPWVSLRRIRMSFLLDAAEVLRSVAPQEPDNPYWRLRLAQVLCMYLEEARDGDGFDPESAIWFQECAVEAVDVYRECVSATADGCRCEAWNVHEGLDHALALLEWAATMAGFRFPGVDHPASQRIHLAPVLADLRRDHPCSCGQCPVDS